MMMRTINDTGENSLEHTHSKHMYTNRYYVLYKMPKLTFLDSRTVTSVERSEAKRKGEFTKVVRPTSNVVSVLQ